MTFLEDLIQSNSTELNALLPAFVFNLSNSRGLNNYL